MFINISYIRFDYERYGYSLDKPFEVELPTTTSSIINVWPSNNATTVSTSPVIVIYTTQPVFKRDLTSKFNVYPRIFLLHLVFMTLY